MKTNYLCMPRFRANTCGRNSRRLSPASLLDRLREAVFRLIMLSALSKATTTTSPQPTPGGHRSCYSHRRDPHHSEAMADCIEFIKKSATGDDNNRDSTASTGSVGPAAAEGMAPVPVI